MRSLSHPPDPDQLADGAVCGGGFTVDAQPARSLTRGGGGKSSLASPARERRTVAIGVDGLVRELTDRPTPRRVLYEAWRRPMT